MTREEWIAAANKCDEEIWSKNAVCKCCEEREFIEAGALPVDYCYTNCPFRN